MLRMLLVTLLLLAGAARAQELVEQDGYLTVRIDGRLTRLESFVARPKESAQPLPVALIAHGKPATEGRMSDMRATHFAPLARDLARRGWLAVVTLRRGFGRSDGPAAGAVSCQTGSLSEALAAAADDLQATIEAVGKRPDADSARIVVIGASAGGAAATALAARDPAGLRGVVNISGGLRIVECPADEPLTRAFAEAARKTRNKALWVYAENDSLFPPRLVDRLHEAFLEAGVDVRRVRLPALGEDGHQLFQTGAGRRRWLAELDKFLRDLDLPTWRQADVEAAARLIGGKPDDARFMEGYLAAPGEKALIRASPRGALSFQFAAGDMAKARKAGLEACEKRWPGQTCAVIAENNEALLEGGRKPLLPAPP